MAKLNRSLGFMDVFSISTGAMISSGLFVLPALAYQKTGPAVVVAYLIAALLVIPAMLSKIELATAMPRSGGAYFFINRSLGPLFGTFSGFAAWLSLALKSAFALVGIGVFLGPLAGEVSPAMVKLIAIGCTLLFTLLNLFSVRESGRFQIILVSALLIILLAYVSAAFKSIDVQRFAPFNPGGLAGILSTTGMIFVSFGGLTKIASVAEEIKDPVKTIPRGMIASFVIVTIFYLAAVFVTTGNLDPSVFGTTLTPISVGAGQIAGKAGFYILGVAAMLAFITTGNAGLMAASRNPLAMARDNLLPSIFSRVSVRLKTPVFSILMTSLFMILCIVFLNLEQLVKVASTMKLLLFAFVNLSVILMRESRIVSYKPTFKSPLYPWIQIAGTLAYIFLIVDMGVLPLSITGGFFLLSLIWYFLYSRSMEQRDSALIRIVERITSKEIRSTKLTGELREILVERDEIIEDRFDAIIKSAEIYDLKIDTTADELFRLLADKWSTKFPVEKEALLSMLKSRECESTTVIQDGLAIPHIVVEGQTQFDIAIVRSTNGINFGHTVPPVHTVFALIGSKDERNFHLQCLMAIAQIVKSADFLKNWLRAHGSDDLRNLILLSDRVRKGDV
jgi:basic amino acid/polyamine antiporter, APA family